MFRIPQIIGAAVGLLLALVVLDRRAPAPIPSGPMLSECGGTIHEIVIHYVAGDTIALPIYQQFLPQLPADVTVRVVCPDQKAFDELIAKIGAHRSRLVPLITGHPMTVWSRDRWIALAPAKGSLPTTLLGPQDEQGADVWPERSGDARTVFEIAAQSGGKILAQKLDVFFDGGDLLADGANIFGTAALLARNLQHTVATRDELLAKFKKALGGDVTLLENPPDHHAGMYMMSVGDRTVIVGDPNAGKAFYTSTFPELPGGPDFSTETQAKFDSVAEQVGRLGYRVVRIPTLLAPDGRTYLTYVNVITDRRDGRKIVYMPTYRGAEPMNAAAAQIWRSLGYEVHPIDCTSCYQSFGTLHCLVNILARG